MKETIKKVTTVLLSVLLWAIILVAALFTFTTLATKDINKVGRLFGYTPLSVLTESMEPTFNAGDLIIIKECDTKELEVGDIVTFYTIIENQYVLNTHRIAEIKENGMFRTYVTKGDNNALADPAEIADGDIVGKYVTRVAFLGTVMQFLSSSTGFLICIVLPMLVFFIYQVYNLVMLSIKLKKEEALEVAEEVAKNSSSNDETEKLKAELEEAKRRLAEAEAAKKEE